VAAVRVLALAAVTLLLTAPPAFAHNRAPHGMVSEVTSVSAPGVHASVDGNGNTTLSVPQGSVVVVDGYDGEPYLRFANGRVSENTRSPSTYLSKGRAPPPSASPDAPPSWSWVADGTTWTWHDHRAHWSAAQPPPVVREHPKQARVVRGWSVNGTIDGRPLRIIGTIRWVPGPHGLGWQWLLVPVLVSMLIYMAYLAYDTRRISRRQLA
jgi:hypothetical protein